MFDHHCPTCAQRVLVFPSMITGFANTERGISVTFECWCGVEQAVISGRAARPAVAEPVAA